MGKNKKNVNSLNLSKGCTLEANCITLQDGQTAKICTENGKTKIMIEQKDVKEKEPQFKKGDIIFLNVQGNNKIYQHLAIVKSIDKDKCVYFSVSFCINEDELSAIHESMWFSKENIKSIRYATEEEKRTLFIAMLNKGLFWDEKKMKVRTLKDGDVITINLTNNGRWYSIFYRIEDGGLHTYADLSKITDNIFIEIGVLCNINKISSIRYSTTEERQTLFDKIEKKEHKKWNVETKKFEKIRWRAKKGVDYWIIDSEGNVHCTTELNYETKHTLSAITSKLRNLPKQQPIK